MKSWAMASIAVTPIALATKKPLRRGHSGDPGIKHPKAASRKLGTVVSIDNMEGGAILRYGLIGAPP